MEILDGIYVRSYVIHLGLPIIGIGSSIEYTFSQSLSGVGANRLIVSLGEHIQL